jgi:hypothetical protein
MVEFLLQDAGKLQDSVSAFTPTAQHVRRKHLPCSAAAQGIFATSI